MDGRQVCRPVLPFFDSLFRKTDHSCQPTQWSISENSYLLFVGLIFTFSFVVCSSWRFYLACIFPLLILSLIYYYFFSFLFILTSNPSLNSYTWIHFCKADCTLSIQKQRDRLLRSTMGSHFFFKRRSWK